ncbi:MAG: T9SS type A sorting domain-containing protein, partial [candidate division Zixibacteria bacterium]|nr:T9SS type A sorting domain-containing protein [candidate division Zixibacteria bacterium]
FDFNLKKHIIAESFAPGEHFAGNYYYHVVNAGGNFNQAAIKTGIGPTDDNWLCEPCEEFIFYRPWGRFSTTDKIIWGTEWKERTVEDDENLPVSTSLGNAYPNPFNASCTIPFSIKESGKVSLKIYNLSGQLVETVVEGNMGTGHHTSTWNATKYSSGIYFYKLTTRDESITRRMTLLK